MLTIKEYIPEEINELSQEFHKAFVEVLGDRLTDTPGPDVVRMRLAVTDLETSSPVSGTMTTVVPVGLAVNLVKRGTTGEYIGVGSASMEAEFLDSVSNERIAVAVDTAPGGKFDLGKLSAANRLSLSGQNV
jgi:glutamate dehydrogenase/leucine dehydrogenase